MIIFLYKLESDLGKENLHKLSVFFLSVGIKVKVIYSNKLLCNIPRLEVLREKIRRHFLVVFVIVNENNSKCNSVFRVNCSKPFNEILRSIFTSPFFFMNFVDYCMVNKVLYFVINKYSLFNLNDEFKKIYFFYQKKELIYFEIVKFINSYKYDRLLKDFKRSMLWIPERDIDVIVLDKFIVKEISEAYLKNKVWSKYYELDVITVEDANNLESICGTLNLSKKLPINCLIGIVFLNGFVRFDEFETIVSNTDNISNPYLNDIRILITNKGRYSNFPFFIPIHYLLYYTFVFKLPLVKKIKLIVVFVLSRIYFIFTGNFLFHPKSKVVID